MHSVDLAFIVQGSSLKKQGWRVGNVLDYWQWHDCWVPCWHAVQRGERLEGAIETGISASPGSPWCTDLRAQESLQGFLIDGKRKSALDNPYHLISTEVPSGLMCLSNERWKEKEWRDSWGPTSYKETSNFSWNLWTRCIWHAMFYVLLY